MPTTVIDGIATRYEVIGSGPPLLMFAPAGFDASMDKWRTTGVYTRIKPLDHLPSKYSCIVFDRRETSGSGGRVERITWAHYVAQGKGLLEHLGHSKAHLMGGCMGCSPVMAFGVMHPAMVQSMVLYWPVGGAKYRISTHQRFVQHLAYVNEHGLEKVVALVRETGKTFGEDPRGGLWAQTIRNDSAFAETYAQNVDRYKLIVTAISRTLFDRDTSPGAEPEDLMQLDIPALVVPGRDASHATSAARYVEECLPKSEYWDAPPAEQTEANACPRILKFLHAIPA
jgi:pimeloyl-ACP methyl ester carboxylesterase